MQLAGCRGLLRTMGPPVDHHSACAADALAAVAFEGHLFGARVVELLVQLVEHLEERGVGADGLLVDLKPTGVTHPGLAPHLKSYVDGVAIF